MKQYWTWFAGGMTSIFRNRKGYNQMSRLGSSYIWTGMEARIFSKYRTLRSYTLKISLKCSMKCTLKDYTKTYFWYWTHAKQCLCLTKYLLQILSWLAPQSRVSMLWATNQTGPLTPTSTISSPTTSPNISKLRLSKPNLEKRFAPPCRLSQTCSPMIRSPQICVSSPLTPSLWRKSTSKITCLSAQWAQPEVLASSTLILTTLLHYWFNLTKVD